MSHVSIAFNQINSPPTQRGMDMANAFVQVFKYNHGNIKKIVYDPYTVLYYTLFNMDYTIKLDIFKTFISNNSPVIIDYLSEHYSEEYKSTEYFKDKFEHWNKCDISEIIYALSENNPLCLQMLHFSKDITTYIHDVIVWNINIEDKYTYHTTESEESEESDESTDIHNTTDYCIVNFGGLDCADGIDDVAKKEN